ncbi:helix-turn-helix domain-containing protein [Bacteroides graminisolvens]|uniref:helix-turn-helix domain-containing protein n=1 Tax=Bacteroides graminisolvens TaxID=477666 RepID=UPI0023F55ECB|nr:helix-turn-helix domain-containing protein [Bacteroides graminisolvens]
MFDTTEDLKNKLDRIERLALLSAKTVLQLDDACILTGLKKSTLYVMTCERRIPHYKNNGRVYFDRTEIENWMKQNRIATAQEIDQQATSYVVTGRMQKGGKK